MSKAKSKALKKRSSAYHLAAGRSKGERGGSPSAHFVYDKATGAYENYFPNKGHASAGLKYKNTDLEFLSSTRKISPGIKSLRRHKVKHSTPLREK